jgi:hypothetical protein
MQDMGVFKSNLVPLCSYKNLKLSFWNIEGGITALSETAHENFMSKFLFLRFFLNPEKVMANAKIVVETSGLNQI